MKGKPRKKLKRAIESIIMSTLTLSAAMSPCFAASQDIASSTKAVISTTAAVSDDSKAITPGDVNSDSKVDLKDVVFLRRFIADGGYNENGYAAKINESAADVNADNKVDLKDVVLLRRYIADGGYNPNGYKVQLRSAVSDCAHSALKHVDAVNAATCKETGNTEYWFCEECSKYFSDEACQNEIKKEDTITKGEHTAVVDPAVAPTTSKTGLTEGSHCSVCGEVLTKQEVVPVLKAGDYSITYNVVGSDTYLESLTIDNPNPTSYSSGDVIHLEELEVPGYTFEGWYDGQGKTANKVTWINADDSGNIKLYAHWSVIEYNINFDMNETMPIKAPKSITYTVNSGATLDNISLKGYYFIGWADENDNLVKSVKKGTYGNITLHPIWTSHRNATRPNDYEKEGAVAVTEWNDEDNNTNVSFIYNIGQIENVPIYQIGEWMNSSDVSQSVSETTSQSFSKECAENYVKAVAEATTNSTSWTLSKEWNETIEEESINNQTISEEKRAAAESYYENTGSWAIGGGVGGSATSTTSDGLSVKLNNSSSVSNTTGGEVGGKIGIESSKGISAAIPLKLVDISASVSNKIYGELSGKIHNERTTGQTHSSELGITHDETSSSTGSWNTDFSVSQSSRSGGSSSFSNAIAKSLSNTERYGKFVSNKEGQINTNATEQYQSNSNSYSNTLAYSTDELKSTTVKYELADAPAGYYRQVLVGTAHVFAIVTYNYATQQYYVNTYSVMDDESYNTYWDYSASTNEFNDHQNGVLPFAVPYEVNEYIGERTTRSNGLTVNKDTGKVNSYTGNDTGVTIPKYVSYDNQEQDSYSSITVTGIEPQTFAGNKDIVAVVLPDTITEIPAGAFKGCTSLKAVVGKNIKTIGAKAFQNCTSLESFTVDSMVESIGNGAFENAGKVTFNAANAAIVDAACNSGAKSIVLNLKECKDTLDNKTLTIPNTTEYFKLEGAGKTLKNVQIVSDAESTEIQNVIINNIIGRPLVTSSKSLTIGTTKLTAPDLALVLTAADTQITAYGQSSIVSNGKNAVLSYNEVYSGTGNTDIARLNVTGNIAVCGKVEGESFVNFDSGKFVTIDDDEFERLLNQTFTLNKSALTLNTDGASKTYQLSLQDLPEEISANDFVWTSSNPSVASVLANGLVTGLKDGSAIITATLNGGSISCEVTVKTAYTDQWTDWTEWTQNKVEPTDLCKVETRTVDQYTDWGNWSSWSDKAIDKTDLRQVETQSVPHTKTVYQYAGPCSASQQSIADGLRECGYDGSQAFRASIAPLNGITNYQYTSAQNIELLNRLKRGELIVAVREESYTTTQYRYRERQCSKVTEYRSCTKIPVVYNN